VNNTIHRDFRLDNTTFNRAQDVIVDNGTAVNFPAGKVAYLGGFTCCPPRILVSLLKNTNPGKRTTIMRLSCSSFSPLSLLYSASCVPQNHGPTSDENARLRSFWKRLNAAVLWEKFVVAAEEGDTETLKEMSKMVVTMKNSVMHSTVAIEPDGIESCGTGIAERLVIDDEE